MDDIEVYYDSTNEVMIECGEMTLVLDREEAETLFVRLGHTLHDMDMMMKNMAE